MLVTNIYVCEDDGFSPVTFEFQIDNTIDKCPVEFALGIIGGKWKPVLLFHLMTGAKRYSELQRLVADASDRMLTRSLRELESDLLVHRVVFAEVPARVEYSLTEDGKSLYPVLVEIYKWGTQRQKR